MSKVNEMVTAKVLQMLEGDIAPWHQPWVAARAMPKNTWDRPYRGINVFMLNWERAEKGYQSNYWLTYKQVSERGGQVIPGSKSTFVVFWKVGKATKFFDEDKNKTIMKRPFMLRYFNVFNLDQTTGVKLTAKMQYERDVLDGKVADLFDPLESAEAIIGTYFAQDGAPKYTDNSLEGCYYSPFEDKVATPPRTAFESAEGFYASIFHEIVHSTGTPKRLKRKVPGEFNHFGSDKYGAEELVAEFGAAFLCAESGIENTIDNSVAYLDNWRKAIKADPGLVVSAAGKAQKAADFVMGITYEETE